MCIIIRSLVLIQYRQVTHGHVAYAHVAGGSPAYLSTTKTVIFSIMMSLIKRDYLAAVTISTPIGMI